MIESFHSTQQTVNINFRKPGNFSRADGFPIGRSLGNYLLLDNEIETEATDGLENQSKRLQEEKHG